MDAHRESDTVHSNISPTSAGNDPQMHFEVISMELGSEVSHSQYDRIGLLVQRELHIVGLFLNMEVVASDMTIIEVNVRDLKGIYHIQNVGKVGVFSLLNNCNVEWCS